MSDQTHRAINDLNKLFVDYCVQVEENVHLAVQSFMKTELKHVQHVIDTEKKIDQMEIEIEEECIKIMAIYQPLAKDLRFIVGILKMTHDLERIADLAVNIVKKVKIFANHDTSLSKQGNSFFLPEMIQSVLNMLKKSLEAFTKRDTQLAREVCQIGADVNVLKQEMNVLVRNKMKEAPEEIEQLCSILKNASHLERISDLSTNVAEDVIYQIEGHIVRHGRGKEKLKVLILCTGNSCRSQMAEGIVRHLYADQCEVYSAGTHPSFVHPKAIEVMQEIDIDISTHTSQSVDEFKDIIIDIVITVCDNAKDNCPVFLGQVSQRHHWPFNDPAESENLDDFRVVRDEIFQTFQTKFKVLIS